MMASLVGLGGTGSDRGGWHWASQGAHKAHLWIHLILNIIHDTAALVFEALSGHISVFSVDTQNQQLKSDTGSQFEKSQYQPISFLSRSNFLFLKLRPQNSCTLRLNRPIWTLSGCQCLLSVVDAVTFIRGRHLAIVISGEFNWLSGVCLYWSDIVQVTNRVA